MPRDEEPEVVDRNEPGPDEPQESEPGEPDGDKGKGGKNGKDKTPAELRELRQRLAASEKRAKELEESERYWAGRAKAAAEPEPEEEDTADEDEEDDEPELPGDDGDKLADDLTKTGIEALVKRGVLTKKAAREMIRRMASKIAAQVSRQIVDERASRMTQDAQLIGEFPDLGKPDSELRKLTAAYFQAEVKRDPEARKSPAVLRMCARLAATELKAKGNGHSREREGDEDVDLEQSDYETPEEGRRRRIDRQDGPRGRRGGDFHDDGLSPLAKQMCEQMGIAEDDYRKFQEPERGRRGRR